jgi:hypothetical protein
MENIDVKGSKSLKNSTSKNSTTKCGLTTKVLAILEKIKIYGG